MSKGIKNKLQELIGKDVGVDFISGKLYIRFSGDRVGGTILRIENDDCVVVKTSDDHRVSYVQIDNVAYIETKE